MIYLVYITNDEDKTEVIQCFMHKRDADSFIDQVSRQGREMVLKYVNATTLI